MPAARTVTVDAGVRYGELCEPLERAGLALHNMASLPHISIAGACATATHGSGDRSGNLATAVSAMELVRARRRGRQPSGAARQATRIHSTPCVVSLGALGVVTSLTLDVEPSYQVRQDVYEDLPVAAFADHFDAITSSADSVSFFTEWRGPSIEHGLAEAPDPTDDATLDLPATAVRRDASGSASGTRSGGLSTEACTPQLGVPGPWYDRLPHFRMDHTPSAGDELQTEYFVPRDHAVEAFLALDGLRDRIAPLIQVSEVRTVAADDLWLSMASGRPSVALHFTWKPDWDAVSALLPTIEAALRPFEPRPHWGKLFTLEPDELRSRYPRLPDFAELARRHDPDRQVPKRFPGPVSRHVLRPSERPGRGHCAGPPPGRNRRIAVLHCAPHRPGRDP